jgi:hypothetical protein
MFVSWHCGDTETETFIGGKSPLFSFSFLGLSLATVSWRLFSPTFGLIYFTYFSFFVSWLYGDRTVLIN